MKKHFLTFMLVLLCVVALSITISANTYTVSSELEYEAAYQDAAAGDTIIVDAELNCDIYANRSLTYVLRANWKSSRLVVNQSNVEVSFIADGGDYKIMPTNYDTESGWLNVSEVYNNVVINLGGMNGGTLTIDGTNATHDRVSYVPVMPEKVQWDSNVFPDICLNLLDGSAIANFNNTTKDDNVNACIIYAKTVNMYDGAQIYGNNVISAPLFKSCYFNMYGGEIFGNLLTSTRFEKNGVGFIYADRQFVMYDGRISENIFNAKSSNYQFNVSGFITTNQYYYGSKGVAVLGGEIGDRYVSGTGNNEISAVFGVYVKDNGQTCFYYNTGIEVGDRYIFTDTPQLTFDQATGKTIWKVSTFSSDVSVNNYGYCWNTVKKSGDKVAIFLDAEKKTIAGYNFNKYTVINAYIEGAYAHSGSTTIAIPSGYDLWSTSANEFCHTGRAYTLDEVKANQTITLYTAYEAEIETVDGTTMCSGCKKPYACSNPAHDLEIVSITYTSYMENGVKVLKCNTCGLEKASEVVATPIFACLGYSAPMSGEKAGIAIGFTIDNEAIKEYRKTGKSISFGAYAVAQQRLGENDIFDENGNATAGVISADLTDYDIDVFELKIVGFAENQKDIKLSFGAYVTEDGKTYSYLQSNTAGELVGSYYAVSYNSVIASLALR